MDKHWEEAHCPICPTGTGSVPSLRCSDRLREPLFKNYQLVRCIGCGLLYLNPRPAPASPGEFHPTQGYDPFVSLQERRRFTDRAYLAARSAAIFWKRRLVRRLSHEGGRILDIGCGTGEFLSALKDGHSVVGLEPEPNAAQWARERLGLTVYTGDLGALPTALDPFDLVTMWHVLEHVPDPARELSTIHQLLNPHGHLLIALPNAASLDALVYGANWIALDAPRHLWHFTPQTLPRLAKNAGFRLLWKGMLPFDTFYNILGSERLIMASRNPLEFAVAPFRAALTGLSSLFWGAISGRHSGLYYIFSREP